MKPLKKHSWWLLLLVVSASAGAEESWLDAEVRAQEARWAARQGKTPSLRPVGLTAVPKPAPRRPVTQDTRRPATSAQVRSAPPRVSPTRPGAAELARIILDNARHHRIDPLLIKAVILAESSDRWDATSPKGAMGLMQLMPGTATRFKVTDPYDPAQSVAGGAAYLRWLLDRFNGDVTLALAGYNAGEGAVDRHGGIPPYRETWHYVRRVRATHAALGRILAQKRVRASE